MARFRGIGEAPQQAKRAVVYTNALLARYDIIYQCLLIRQEENEKRMERVSARIYVSGQRKDVERFYAEIIYPDLGRLRDDERFRVTENNMKYEERNKTTGAVERVLRGYSPTLKYRNRPGLWERYVVDWDDIEEKSYGKDLEKVTGVQVTIHLRSDSPSEIKLIYDEMIETKKDVFTVDQDTGIYINRRDYSSRYFGGHFNKAD